MMADGATGVVIGIMTMIGAIIITDGLGALSITA
jgi:hypothetical protein